MCESEMDINRVIKIKDYVSPCGLLRLGAFGGRLCLCHWLHGKHGEREEKHLAKTIRADLEAGTSPVIEAAELQLDEYFWRKRREFSIPLLFVGTDFQKMVWNELLRIPFGTTVSYAEIACRIGRPTAVRAVANANGANPIAIFVPCHRVIGSNGTLTGYAGGLLAKRFLLELEGDKGLF